MSKPSDQSRDVGAAIMVLIGAFTTTDAEAENITRQLAADQAVILVRTDSVTVHRVGGIDTTARVLVLDPQARRGEVLRIPDPDWAQWEAELDEQPDDDENGDASAD